MQGDLFGGEASAAVAWPEGLRFEDAFLSPEEEARLDRHHRGLPLANMKYQQFTALRRVVSYGGQYDFSAQRLNAAAPLPAWLDPVRQRAGAWAGIAPERFSQALVAEYQPGTPLGWHRDVPDFEDIVGISLLGDAVMRFRAYPPTPPKNPTSCACSCRPAPSTCCAAQRAGAGSTASRRPKQLRYSITLRTSARALALLGREFDAPAQARGFLGRPGLLGTHRLRAQPGQDGAPPALLGGGVGGELQHFGGRPSPCATGPPTRPGAAPGP
jgi:alkylated DNA repair dioxygenase AlkB